MKMYSVISMCGISIVTFLTGMACEVMKGMFQGTDIGTLQLQASNIIDELLTDNEILCAQACLQNNCAAFMYRESDSVIVDDHCHDSDTASGYSGRINTTVTGKTCQRWDSDYPYVHNFTALDFMNDSSLKDAENYCRSPDNDDFVWCFTTATTIEWQYCDVVKCMDAQYNCRLYNMTTAPYTTRSGIKYFVRDTPGVAE